MKPSLDFYKRVNRSYLKNLKIPEGESVFGFPIKIQREIFKRLEELPLDVNSPFSVTLFSDMRKVGTLAYNSVCRNVIRKIQAVKSHTDVPDLVYRLQANGCACLFNFHAGADFSQPGQEILYLEEANPLFVSETDHQSYTDFLGKKFGVKFTMSCKQILAFERVLLAKKQLPEEKNDLKKNFNPLTTKQIDRKHPFLKWVFSNLKTFPNKISLDNPAYYFSLHQHLTNKKKLKSWKNYLLLIWLDFLSPLFSDTYQHHFKVHRSQDFQRKPFKKLISHKVRVASSCWWQDAGIQYVDNCVNQVLKNHAIFYFQRYPSNVYRYVRK